MTMADVVLKDSGHEEPLWEKTPGEAAELGTRWRGAEPLRIVVMPQHDRQTITAPVVEPMPIVI